METPAQCVKYIQSNKRHSGVLIFDFEQILQVVLVFQSFT